MNPAAAVRAPKHVVTKGATPVLSPAEARRLLEATETGTLAGLRDRALLSVMLYSFARVSAVVAMRRADYFRQESRGWLRLHEKGGKRHDVPAHPSGGRGARRLPPGGRARRGEGTAVPERRPGGAAADGAGAVATARPGDDQAAGGGGGSLAVDLLPHVPGDGDHGILVERGDARARAADRGARVAEDDQALRPDGRCDQRRRDQSDLANWTRGDCKARFEQTARAARRAEPVRRAVSEQDEVRRRAGRGSVADAVGAAGLPRTPRRVSAARRAAGSAARLRAGGAAAAHPPRRCHEPPPLGERVVPQGCATRSRPATSPSTARRTSAGSRRSSCPPRKSGSRSAKRSGREPGSPVAPAAAVARLKTRLSDAFDRFLEGVADNR